MSRNADPRELARFEQAAARWWDPDGEMGPLHAINPPRLRYIEAAAGGLDGRRIVDVGCGGGLLSEALAARGAEVIGLDLAEEVLAVARAHAQESGLKLAYRASSAEDFAAEQPGAFDVVTCLEMLEHVPEPAAVVAACARLARPGGTVVFSTINRNPKAYALAIVAAEYVLNLIPRGTHDYARLIRPSELARWAEAAGLEVLDIRGLRYNPLTRSGSLSRDTDVNYLMQCRRPA
jgi:2-polyprenyl-6-hydroxyphenyl methylase / 3-demethylubiquinone-9 3-methyltransferase